VTPAPSDHTPRSLKSAVAILLRQVEQCRAPIRLEQTLVETDLLSWLGAQSSLVRLYWRSRDGEFELAGIGIADERSSAQALSVGIPALRYIGGQRFDLNHPRVSSEWEQFGNGRFICPLIEVRRTGNEYRLAVNLLRDSLVGLAREQLRSMTVVPCEFPSTAPTVVSQVSDPDRSEFLRTVRSALLRINDGELSKVALARTLQLELDDEISPWWLLAKWRIVLNGSFLFGMQTLKGDTFISATPERLYQRCGRTIRTEAVAGTRSTGVSREEDERLGQELLDSDKDRREHLWVQEAIAESLGDLTSSLTFTPTRLLKLHRLQHLVSTAVGTLRADVSDRQLLDLLPPTPAVAGYPRVAALEAIRKLEWIDRGWYAGPIGWLGADEAEFAVGIRSCLLEGRLLTAYAGVGIVEGSMPDTEWRETEEKLASFIGQVVAI